MPAATFERVARCLLLDSLAAEASDALRRAGIESVLLKGPATVHRLYGDDPTARAYSDVDLLVPPDRWEDARRVLATLGFVERHAGRGAFDDHDLMESVWLRAGGERLDLHRSFHHVRDRNAFWAGMAETAEPLAVGDSSVLVPDAAGTALVCALHAAANGERHAHSGKSLHDLHQAVVMLDHGTWRLAARRASTVGAEDALAAGLRLVDGGEDLAARLRLTTAASTLTLLSAHGSAAPGSKTVALFMTGGHGRRGRILRNLVLPSRRTLEQRAGRRLGPAGLVSSYGARAARIATQSPPALLAWRRAAKESEASGWTPAAVSREDRRRTARWVTDAVREARAQLTSRPLGDVRLPTPPPVEGPATRLDPVVRRAAVGCSATCLEESVVRQAWLAAGGVARDVVLGVTAPSAGFRAHAWLDDDADGTGFTELSRHRPVVPRLPDFVVIGAPKAGTTSLFHYLRAHPGVFLPDDKEPEFFNLERNWRRGPESYAGLFAGARPGQVCGEASVRYATTRAGSEHVPERLASICPDASLVYVVRHPVDRMVSQWQHNRTVLSEHRPLAAVLDDRRYLDPSRYADRVAPYLEHFSPERLHVVVAERLRDDRAAELRRLFGFLGVDADTEPSGIDLEHNRSIDRWAPRPWTAAASRTPLGGALVRRGERHTPQLLVPAVRRLTRTRGTPVQLDPVLRAEVAERFADDVRRLRPLVGGDFDGWGIG